MIWFRWYSGTYADPKFGSIARKIGASRERVLVVWMALLESASEGDDRGVIKTDADAIADVLNCPTEDVQAVIDALECHGLVRDMSVTNWTKRQFENDKDRGAAARKRKQREKAKLDQGVAKKRVTRDRPVTVTPVSRPDTDTDTEKKEDSSLRSLSRAIDEKIDDGFGAFWDAYPKRSGSANKAEARKRYSALVSKSPELQSTILAGAENYAQSAQENQQVGTSYIAMASTWLNQKRWQDEYTPPANPDAPDRPRNRITEAFDNLRSAGYFDEGGALQ